MRYRVFIVRNVEYTLAITTIRYFFIIILDTPVQATLDIGRAMLKCQSEAFRTNNWRMKESLLVQWECLPMCFPSDFIHQHFSPVVLNATIYGVNTVFLLFRTLSRVNYCRKPDLFVRKLPERCSSS